MKTQRRTLILILVFTMFMAISASATRVWVDEMTPKQPARFQIREHESLKTNGQVSANQNLIRLTSPSKGEFVYSPLQMEGEARGYWFFEGDAPAKILDADGDEVARGYISAIDSWMTEDFVRFEGRLDFEEVKTSTGTLILMNANASGDPERDIFLHIPIRFE